MSKLLITDLQLLSNRHVMGISARVLKQLPVCYTCTVFLKETLQGLVAHSDRAELHPGPEVSCPLALSCLGGH